MEPVPINYLAVVAAAAVNMVIGSVWFGPALRQQMVAVVRHYPGQDRCCEGKRTGNG